jgi:coenzyme F420 hydrogenase subunit beta
MFDMDIRTIVKSDLCLGCGICSYDPQIKKMYYNQIKGYHEPFLEEREKVEIGTHICPAKGYNIIDESTKLFGEKSDYTIELGFVQSMHAAHSNSSQVIANASSGGVMTQILIYLLEKQIVEKVVVTKLIYTPDGPRTKTLLTNNIEDILESQGSKYCPVEMSSVIAELKKSDCKISFVGTPCQIAGIREIQKIDEKLKKNIIITISNFCGGFKNHNNVKKLAARHSIDYKNISFLRFRGCGQPGSLFMKDIHCTQLKIPYPNYMGLTGYSKMLRCHLCVDATGELADIACGDAWIDKYLIDQNPWSIVLTRNEFSTQIIQEMRTNGLLELDKINHSEICLSQRQNLLSKKIRQYSRFRLYKILGYRLPKFDGGFYLNPTSMKTEIIVYFTHKIKEIIEKIGLYRFLRNINKLF